MINLTSNGIESAFEKTIDYAMELHDLHCPLCRQECQFLYNRSCWKPYLTIASKVLTFNMSAEELSKQLTELENSRGEHERINDWANQWDQVSGRHP